jgi:hypothetical protein
MTHRHPFDFDGMIAWWLGEAPESQAATFEEHLFECAHCARQLSVIAALAAGARAAVAEGGVRLVVSAPFVEAMKHAGLRLREYRLEPGGSVNCTIRADDDAVVSRLRAPLHNVQRLEVVYLADNQPEVRLADVPFDAAIGEVLMIPAAAHLKPCQPSRCAPGSSPSTRWAISQSASTRSITHRRKGGRHRPIQITFGSDMVLY